MVLIKEVLRGSIAEKQGLLSGDYIISINGKEINDVLDYRFYIAEPKIKLRIHREADIFDITVKKPIYDDIGLEFETFLMDEKRSCRNKCIFCFVDQLPRGMRDTLYFKDDDSRLSFLMGNYITLTNMDEHDISRIIEMKMSPINISVHTTNPELRCKMLNNRFAGECLDNMRRFAEAGIEMHCQIVLCKGINDGEELERTMNDLAELYPSVNSVSVVPSGVTKYRDGLYPLEIFSKSDCLKVIRQVEAFSEKCKLDFGSRIFFCADEMYVKAELDYHSSDYYEEYPQIENGVGMLRSMEDEFENALECLDKILPNRALQCSIATGEAAYKFISSLAQRLTVRIPNLKCNVYKITNEFFGENITVAGLLTGLDLYKQLKGKKLGDILFLPSVMLRHERDKFLDDTTPEWLEESLGVEIVFTESDGYDFVEKLTERLRSEE